MVPYIKKRGMICLMFIKTAVTNYKYTILGSKGGIEKTYIFVTIVRHTKSLNYCTIIFKCPFKRILDLIRFKKSGSGWSWSWTLTGNKFIMSQPINVDFLFKWEIKVRQSWKRFPLQYFRQEKCQRSMLIPQPKVEVNTEGIVLIFNILVGGVMLCYLHYLVSDSL